MKLTKPSWNQEVACSLQCLSSVVSLRNSGLCVFTVKFALSVSHNGLSMCFSRWATEKVVARIDMTWEALKTEMRRAEKLHMPSCAQLFTNGISGFQYPADLLLSFLHRNKGKRHETCCSSLHIIFSFSIFPRPLQMMCSALEGRN